MSKFTIGAWIPAVVIPIIVVVLRADPPPLRPGARRWSTLTPDWRPKRYDAHRRRAGRLACNKATLNALTYARSLAPDRLVAVTVVGDAEEQERDAASVGGVPHPDRAAHHLLALPGAAPTRCCSYLDELDAENDDDIITVVLPEFVHDQWWEQLLHNQSALSLKLALLYRPHTVVVSVPFHVDVKEHRTEEVTVRTESAPTADPTP